MEAAAAAKAKAYERAAAWERTLHKLEEEGHDAAAHRATLGDARAAWIQARRKLQELISHLSQL